VGAPLEAGIVRAGAVTVLYGSPAGLSGVGSQLFTQNSRRVPDIAEAGDRFGEALAGRDRDFDGFAERVSGAAAPIDDVRGTAGYRRHACRVLARRALAWALAERVAEAQLA